MVTLVTAEKILSQNLAELYKLSWKKDNRKSLEMYGKVHYWDGYVEALREVGKLTNGK